MALNPPKIETGSKEEFGKLNQYLAEIAVLVNGGLGIDKNLNVSIVDVTFRGAGVETPVDHNLKRKPTGWLMIGNFTSGTTIYQTEREGDANRIYLASPTAGAKVKLMFF